MNVHEIINDYCVEDAALVIKPVIKSDGYVGIGVLYPDLKIAIIKTSDETIKISEKLGFNVDSLESSINSSIPKTKISSNKFTSVSFCYHRRDDEYKIRIVCFNKNYTALLKVLSVNDDIISTKLSFVYPYIYGELLKKLSSKTELVSSEMLKKAIDMTQVFEKIEE